MTAIEDVRARHPAAYVARDRQGHHLRSTSTAAPSSSGRRFVVIGTHGSKGADVSPRGDPAGFVRVLDDRHVLLPDRIGNNRFELDGEHVRDRRHRHAVPGARHGGGAAHQRPRAHHRRCRGCLPASAVQGRAPKIGVLVEVQEAYLHCAKAINRAGLWDPSRHIDRNDLPSYGDMLVDHCAGLTREESERHGLLVTGENRSTNAQFLSGFQVVSTSYRAPSRSPESLVNPHVSRNRPRGLDLAALPACELNRGIWRMRATIKAEPYEFTFDLTPTALLIIDMQRDFVEPGGFGEALGNDVTPLRAVIAPCKACSTPRGAPACW